MIKIIGLGLVGAIIVFTPSFFLHKIFKDKWYLKYIPAILVLILGLIFLRLSFISHRGFEDLAYLVVSILLLISFLFSLIGLVILDIGRIKRLLGRIFFKKI